MLSDHTPRVLANFVALDRSHETGERPDAIIRKNTAWETAIVRCWGSEKKALDRPILSTTKDAVAWRYCDLVVVLIVDRLIGPCATLSWHAARAEDRSLDSMDRRASCRQRSSSRYGPAACLGAGTRPGHRRQPTWC